MVLITLLTLIGAMLLTAATAAIVVGGVSFIVVFADVIVCVAFIIFVIKTLIKRKRK